VKAKIQQEVNIPELCRSFVDASPLPMARVEGTNHGICYVNSAFCAITGKSSEALMGMLFADCVNEGDGCLPILERVSRNRIAEVHTGLETFVAGNTYWSYVMWPVQAANGCVAGVMIQVMETAAFHQNAIALNQALLIGSVRQHELTDAAEALNEQLEAEIAQRKYAEQEMEKQQREVEASERQYRGLIEAIPQIVWTATPEGRIDFANSKWMECLGIDIESFNEAGWAILLGPAEKEEQLKAWAAGIRSEHAFQVEHRLTNVLTGKFRWYLSRAVPIGSGNGQVMKWFGTTTDIQDQKEAELALFNKQKLESLGVLAGGIAHDFNNLLCVVLGGASMVADALQIEDPLQGYLTDIVQATERASHLTRQMLAYAGKGQFVMEYVQMSGLVQSTCDLIRASIPKNVKLTVQALSDLAPVKGDSGQLQQVVMNLVMNAAEAIDQADGGSVRVRTSEKNFTAEEIQKIGLITGTLAAGPYIVVEIEDSGSGMDEETKEKIFDPFFTTKFTGRGLGLSAVQGIVRGQKGALELKSAIGSGSTFRVYLPAAPARNVLEESQVPTVQRRGTGTILVVDDEDMVRRMIQLSLENGGFTVRLAASGEEAIAILTDKSEDPISLLLLDLSMPGMSGKQAMEQMKTLGVRIPILICSGYSEEEISLEFSGLDIAGVVKKPFTGRQLADAVSGVLNPEQRDK